MTSRMDEWIAELEKHQSAGDEGQTVAEIADTLSIPRERVHKLLHAAQDGKRLVVGSRPAKSLNGRTFPQTVYRIAPKGKRKAA